jgi:putative flippase GtrA
MQRLSALMGLTYVRYGIGSVVALGSDVGLFMVLMALGLAAVPASALGYTLGIFIHWLISSRLVFASAAAPAGPARTRQKTLFVGSALVGLALTTGIVALGGLLGLMPFIAKLCAIVVSFQATYLLRKTMVFTTS